MGDVFMSSIRELIDSLRLLLKEAPAILASPEDAAYFRSSILKKKIEAQPVPAAQLPVKQPDPPPQIEAAVDHDRSNALNLDGKILRSSSAVEIESNLHNVNEIEQRAGAQKIRKQISNDLADRGITPRLEPEPEKPRPAAVLSSIRTLLAKIAPELAILDEIPNDSIARKIANRWKTKNQSAPISILSGGELPQHKVFLEEIAAALDVYFGSAKIVQAEPIEKENQWESFLGVEGLKLILICDSTLWQLYQLRRFYKETPALGSRMLGKTPLFLLPDPSLYFKDPQLKRSLWKALCQTCS